MEGQVTDVEHEVIITNNNLLFQLSGHNNDLLVESNGKVYYFGECLLSSAFL